VGAAIPGSGTFTGVSADLVVLLSMQLHGAFATQRTDTLVISIVAMAGFGRLAA